MAVNRPVTAAMAEAMADVFTEVLIAPGYADAALALLAKKKNLRVLHAPPPEAADLEIRTLGAPPWCRPPTR